MNLVNLKTCAEHFNTTTITIKQWIKKGWLKRIEVNYHYAKDIIASSSISSIPDKFSEA